MIRKRLIVGACCGRAAVSVTTTNGISGAEKIDGKAVDIVRNADNEREIVLITNPHFSRLPVVSAAVEQWRAYCDGAQIFRLKFQWIL